MSIIKINENPNCRVLLGTGSMFPQEFHVQADNKTTASNLVADYCTEYELHGLYADHYELVDLCEAGQTVDEFASVHNLTCCGKHGVYINIIGIEELKDV